MYFRLVVQCENIWVEVGKGGEGRKKEEQKTREGGGGKRYFYIRG